MRTRGSVSTYESFFLQIVRSCCSVIGELCAKKRVTRSLESLENFKRSLSYLSFASDDAINGQTLLTDSKLYKARSGAAVSANVCSVDFFFLTSRTPSPIRRRAHLRAELDPPTSAWDCPSESNCARRRTLRRRRGTRHTRHARVQNKPKTIVRAASRDATPVPAQSPSLRDLRTSDTSVSGRARAPQVSANRRLD